MASAKASTKEPATKTAAAKSTAKKAPAKKSARTKPSTPAGNKSAAKKTAARKYSTAASEQVGRELHEMHQGKLTIGRSDKKVTNPKQAIAIGLAEARRAGKKVPPNPNTPEKE